MFIQTAGERDTALKWGGHFSLNGTSWAFESQVYSQLRSIIKSEEPAGKRSPTDDQCTGVKWSSNSLMKPPELKPRVINIDWGLDRFEHILDLLASLSTQKLEGFVNKLLKLWGKWQVMFPYPKVSLGDASTPSEVSEDTDKETDTCGSDGGNCRWRRPLFCMWGLLLFNQLKLSCRSGQQGADQSRTHSKIYFGKLLFDLNI